MCQRRGSSWGTHACISAPAHAHTAQAQPLSVHFTWSQYIRGAGDRLLVLGRTAHGVSIYRPTSVAASYYYLFSGYIFIIIVIIAMHCHMQNKITNYATRMWDLIPLRSHSHTSHVFRMHQRAHRLRQGGEHTHSLAHSHTLPYSHKKKNRVLNA